MSALSGITIEINGAATDLADASWYEKAPCGCVCGVHSAYSDYGTPAMVIATAEQAAAAMWETTKVRAKYESLGFTVFADRRDKCRELMVNECPHEPRFGVPPRPQVDGHVWAAVDEMGSRTQLMHLVPEIAVENARERRFGTGTGAPLCGGKAAFWWKTESHVLFNKVECSRCVKRAAAAAVAVSA